MSDIPLNFVREITVNIVDGRRIGFDVSALIAKGLEVEEIEKMIEDYLSENDEEVQNIEFHINVKAVASVVTKKVTKILGK